MFELLHRPGTVGNLALIVAIEGLLVGGFAFRAGFRLGKARKTPDGPTEEETRQEHEELSGELAKLRAKLDETEVKLIAAEARLTPRTVSAEQREQFFSLAKTVPKGPVHLAMFGTDPEEFQYAKQLQRLLIDAGYAAGSQIGQLQLSGDGAAGLRVAVASNENAPPHARPLVRGLQYSGFAVSSVVDRRTAPNAVNLLVGSKESRRPAE